MLLHTAVTETVIGSEAFWTKLSEDPKALAADVCYVDMIHFDRTLQRHSALHAWVATAYENSRIDLEKAQWELDKASARALLAARGKDDVTGKTKTDAVVKAEALLAPEVEQWNERVHNLDLKKSALKQMERALNGRKDLLVEMARRYKHEMDSYSRPQTPNAQRA